MAICIWLHIAMKVVYLDFRIISLCLIQRSRVITAMYANHADFRFTSERIKKIFNEFLLFPGFFSITVFLAFFPCLNKSIMLLRKPCCYYYVCRCCCCCCCRCSGVSLSFVLCIVLIFYVFFSNEICIRNWNLKRFC